MDVMAALQEALRQQQKGELAQAEAGYRRVLEGDANQPQALLLLGVVCQQTGRAQEAVELIARAVKLEPRSPQFRLNYGFALKACGRVDEALAEYGEAVRLKPDYATAHFNMAVALEEMHRPADSVAAYERAIAAKPDYVDAYNNLCWVLLTLARFDRALDVATRAVGLRPDLLRVHSCLAATYSGMQRFAEAEEVFRNAENMRAAAPAPDRHVFDVEQAICAFLQERAEEGVAILDEVVREDPGNADARFYRGTMLLALGRFADGWADYERRWETKAFLPTMRRFAQPKWEGSSLNGRTILLWAEQGSGDTIQFVRYASLLARAGARVIVECQAELVELLASVEGIAQVVPRGGALPEFDVHCAMMSLPLLLGTTLESIPRVVPYIHPDAALQARWARRIGRSAGQINVGLAWAGSPGHRRDRWRSIPFQQMLPLLAARNVRWFSLQKGAAAAALGEAGPEIVDLDPELSAMDLVITVDTSIAHLAGALGKQTWVLLPTPADFRWMLGREDTPWYPTMRLVRQRRHGDWDGVIAVVKLALAGMAG